MNECKIIVGFLNNFSFKKHDICSQHNDLVIELTDYKKIYKLNFFNISTLEICDLNFERKLVVSVQDVSKQQLEDIGFMVTELEENSFSFYFQTFDYSCKNII